MRVLVVPDGFTGTLTAPQAAAAVAQGWLAARPQDDVELCPLSDGGPGFVEVLAGALPGRLLQVEVSGPLGEPVTAALLLDDGGTAWVESALACGSALVPAGARDPLRAGTTGVGQLLAAARDAGARRVVVGLGGSGTTDAGAGLLAALGAGPADLLGCGGGALARVRAADLRALPPVRASWAPVVLEAASDVDVPLLGPHGAARGFGPQKGADAGQVELLEEALAAFSAAVTAALEAAGERPGDLAGAPGAGAAGGLGFGLAVLGATRTGGAQAVADAVGLAGRVAAADVVVTGEGSLDWQSLRGKVVAQVARAGTAAGVPVLALAGQVRLTPAQARDAGLHAAVAVAATPDQVPAALAAPAATLAARAREVAAGWAGAGTVRAPGA